MESEQLYAKSLSKMASKLNKACREVPGTLADAWRNVAAEMESRSEVHRQFSTTMTEEIVKPLKQILDNQHKTRKSVISNHQLSLSSVASNAFQILVIVTVIMRFLCVCVCLRARKSVVRL